ncbi:alpha/beta fold hydrolase [Blastococcus xanthinilyticus]|uniref:Alpha/beta hydrolase family protein n=1 Tax=Blastococcus xanthinilyticus TaxID=1564164 RepID=A0A5S5CNK9_9ACTN|nr:alpha/beta fold hydrolase [Blastococcus xanthinilyticus]TYP81106.1 alpha/beta hydrolase family protein [Blastococcus xanthinilyticus]
MPAGRARRSAAGTLLAVAVVAGCGSAAEPVPGEQASTVAAQRVWCAGSGPAVVLVNGIGDDASAQQWREVQRELADRARVCRYDRPGTGDSPAPEGPDRGADELDAELAAVVAHAAGSGEVVLVAHSFGGYLALVHAQRHPDRVAGLVLVDALAPSVGVLRGTGAADLAGVPMADERLDLTDVESAAAAVADLPGDPPTVVLSRGEGASASWTAGQAALAALSTRSRSVVVAAGHQIPSERPEAVVAAVDELLAELG